jgi:signal transduction histidine kinase
MSQRRALPGRGALQQNDLLYRSIVDTSSEAIYVRAADGRMLVWNGAAEVIFDIPATQALDPSVDRLGLRDWQWLHLDGTPMSAAELPSYRVLATGEPLVGTVVGFDLKGERRWIEVNCSPLFEDPSQPPYAVVTVCRDITDRQRADEEIARLTRVRDTAERVARIGSWRWVLATQRSEWSPEMYVLFDVDPGDMDGDVLPILQRRLPPDDLERVLATSEQTLRAALGGDPIDRDGGVEYRVIHRDGSEHILHANAAVEHDIEGRPVALVGYYQDITEARRAEEQTARLTELRNLSEHIAGLGSYSFDLRSGRTMWSPEFYRILDWEMTEGQTIDEALPKMEQAIAERVHPDDRERVRSVFEEFYRTWDPIPVDFRIVHRDGSVHRLVNRSQVEVGADGDPSRIVGYFMDITEQWEKDQELAQLMRWRDQAEQAGAAGSGRLVLADGEVTWTPGMFRIFDIEPEGFAMDLEEIVEARVHPDDRKQVLETIASAQPGEPTTFTTRVIWRNGAEHVIQVSGGAELGEAGEAVALAGVFLDVTERERATAEIRRLNAELAARVLAATEQRDALNRELEAYAYSIAHDVRAPLRSIDGFSAVVLEADGERLSEEGSAALHRVRLAAQRLARLLDDLMGLSHVSQRDLLRRPVDVSALAAEVGEELAADNASRCVRLVVQPGMGAKADKALVRLALRELLGNAWKFTRPHAEATIEVGSLDVDGEQVFFVRDDGVGFDMRFADHLFGAFQRMHASDQFPGDGIGLATVQRLVRRHGGRVWAEAEAEHGATFFFTLEARDAGAAAAGEPAPGS